jgi:hypothetical protein
MSKAKNLSITEANWYSMVMLCEVMISVVFMRMTIKETEK